MFRFRDGERLFDILTKLTGRRNLLSQGICDISGCDEER
jgi:hypothetical protein